MIKVSELEFYRYINLLRHATTIHHALFWVAFHAPLSGFEGKIKDFLIEVFSPRRGFAGVCMNFRHEHHSKFVDLGPSLQYSIQRIEPQIRAELENETRVAALTSKISPN